MALGIRDVENILGLHRGLRPPRHVLMTQEHIVERVNGCIVFRGMQPKARRDVMVLTPDADAETVVHETLHANFGIGEAVAYPLARLLVAPRNWARATLGIFRNGPVLPRLRTVHYEKCTGCEEFKELHNMYGGRAEHYVRV